MGLEAWQVMLGVMVVPAVLYGLLSFAIPESPRFLISAGKVSRAHAVLREVEGDDVDLDARVAEIEHAMKSEHKSTFKDLLGGGGFFFKPIVWVGIGLSAFQQLVGINVAFYYSSTLWQSVGVDPTQSFFYSFTTSIVNIIGTVIAMIFVDRIGRKPLALIGSVGMVVGLALEAWAFSYHLVDGKLPSAQGWTALVAAHVFVLFFALSWGVVVWVFLGEMFPNRIRAAALGVAASRAVDRQLGHHRELPLAGRLEPVGDLRDLHRLRRALHPVRPQVRQGDEGQETRGHGLTQPHEPGPVHRGPGTRGDGLHPPPPVSPKPSLTR